MAQIEPSAPQRQAIAVASAVLFHVGLLLLLWVLKLSSERPVPKPSEVLIAVNVGNVASASGAVEPGGTPDVTEPAPQVQAPPKASPRPAQPAMTLPEPTPKRSRSRMADQPLATQEHERSLSSRLPAGPKPSAKLRPRPKLPSGRLKPSKRLAERRVSRSAIPSLAPSASSPAKPGAKARLPRARATKATPTGVLLATP